MVGSPGAAVRQRFGSCLRKLLSAPSEGRGRGLSPILEETSSAVATMDSAIGQINSATPRVPPSPRGRAALAADRVCSHPGAVYRSELGSPVVGAAGALRGPLVDARVEADPGRKSDSVSRPPVRRVRSSIKPSARRITQGLAAFRSLPCHRSRRTVCPCGGTHQEYWRAG